MRVRRRLTFGLAGRALAGLAAALTAQGCLVGHADVRADTLRYPASFSAGLPDEQGRLQLVDRDLVVVGKVDESWTEWFTLYGAIHGDEKVDLSEELNRAVRERGGEGIANLKVDSEACGFVYVPILNWLPFWPGCIVIGVEGDIVKRARRAAPAPAAQARGDAH
jgi:hypothetical protein